MTGEPTITCWDIFEKVYCINVAERDDRQLEANAQFARVGLNARVEFVTVQKDQQNPEAGIYESHLACLRQGLKAGAANILIFEDDIIFERFDPHRLQRGLEFVLRQPEWKAFFLGCLVSASKKTAHQAVMKIDYRCLTHAYAVSRDFAKALVSLPWQQVPYDGILRKFSSDGFYVLHPSLAFQSNSPTDNDRLANLDKLRRACGGLRQIQKMNEYYHRHRPTIIGLHLLAIIFGLIWIWIK